MFSCSCDFASSRELRLAAKYKLREMEVRWDGHLRKLNNKNGQYNSLGMHGILRGCTLAITKSLS